MQKNKKTRRKPQGGERQKKSGNRRRVPTCNCLTLVLDQDNGCLAWKVKAGIHYNQLPKKPSMQKRGHSDAPFLHQSGRIHAATIVNKVLREGDQRKTFFIGRRRQDDEGIYLLITSDLYQPLEGDVVGRVIAFNEGEKPSRLITAVEFEAVEDNSADYQVGVVRLVPGGAWVKVRLAGAGIEIHVMAKPGGAIDVMLPEAKESPTEEAVEEIPA